MSCRAFFEENQNNSDKCKLLRSKSIADLMQWEAESASEYSPGVVQNNEILYRQIVFPLHISDDGNQLKPDAFNECATHGLSVNRGNYTTEHEMAEAGAKRVEKYNQENLGKLSRKLLGFALFSTAEVRNVQFNGSRCFFIFDTALPVDRSHSDICLGGSDTAQNFRRARSLLYDLVKNRLFIKLGAA